MKTIIMVTVFIFTITYNGFAQANKMCIYGEIGLGGGQATINSATKQVIKKSLGGGFEPGIGNNLLMAFYIAPQNWKGLGIGARIQGTFGLPVIGDFGDRYVFNYYNLALAAKYFIVSHEFNKGLHVNGSVGFGQLTTKRLNDNIKAYQH